MKEEWTIEEWDAFEWQLEADGYKVIHCSHCDRSNRHPSCIIVPLSTDERATDAGGAER